MYVKLWHPRMNQFNRQQSNHAPNEAVIWYGAQLKKARKQATNSGVALPSLNAEPSQRWNGHDGFKQLNNSCQAPTYPDPFTHNASVHEY